MDEEGADGGKGREGEGMRGREKEEEVGRGRQRGDRAEEGGKYK